MDDESYMYLAKGLFTDSSSPRVYCGRSECVPESCHRSGVIVSSEKPFCWVLSFSDWRISPLLMAWSNLGWVITEKWSHAVFSLSKKEVRVLNSNLFLSERNRAWAYSIFHPPHILLDFFPSSIYFASAPVLNIDMEVIFVDSEFFFCYYFKIGFPCNLGWPWTLNPSASFSKVLRI